MDEQHKVEEEHEEEVKEKEDDAVEVEGQSPEEEKKKQKAEVKDRKVGGVDVKDGRGGGLEEQENDEDEKKGWSGQIEEDRENGWLDEVVRIECQHWEINSPKLLIKVCFFETGARLRITPEFHGVGGDAEAQKSAAHHTQHQEGQKECYHGEARHKRSLAHKQL